MGSLVPLLIGLAGCGTSVDCDAPGAKLVDGAGDASLTCAEGEDVIEYIEILAGRPVAVGDEDLVLAAVAGRFRSDVDGTRAWLRELRTAGAALENTSGQSGAEARSREVYRADAGQGLIRSDMGDLWSVQHRALAVWAKDPAEQIALSESDIEAWIRLASLCREVQGGGVVRVSVADRVSVYKSVIDRFQTGDRAAKLALASLGGVWTQVSDHWKGATYEQQQLWISRAPLPPPMTATSLGYAEAVFRGDVAGLSKSLFDTLGPLDVGGVKRRFSSP